MCRKTEEKIPDISEVDFDTRLNILLSEPPEEEADGDTASSPPSESDEEKL